MALPGKKLWQKLAAVSEESKKDKEVGQKLFKEFGRQGYINLSDGDRVTLSSGAVCDFYRRLSLIRSASSPVVRRRDDRWLREGDYQFINLREYGSFFRILSELPRFRSDCLVFLPVTDSDEARPLHPRSHSQLDHRLSDPYLESLGFTPEQQFQLLVSAVHLCGKKAGYYLSPLIDPVSAVIYRKPEFFSWQSDGGSKRELTARVNALVAEEFQKTGRFDYALLKDMLSHSGLQPVSDETGSVCFDFNEEGALQYFSRIFCGLQSQFFLDFVYLALPKAFSDPRIETVYSSLRESGGCKRYTGFALELSELQKYPEIPDEPVLLTNREKDRFPLDEEFIHTWFHQLGNLQEKNRGRKIPVTQGVIIPESRDMGSADLMRVLFLSRFSGVRLFRRPLVLQKNVTKLQNRIEDIYQRYKTVLEKGELLRVVADESYAWWIIREKGRLLIPVMALNSSDGRKPGTIKIDYSAVTGRNQILSVLDYDFTSSQGSLFLSGDNSITITDLKPGDVRLLSLQ